MKQLTVILLVAAALSACGEQTHDVQYYLDHPKERAAKLAACKNNPGDKRLAPNCVNAKEALHKARFRGDGMPKIR